MSLSETLLIIAGSGRMLAEAAHKAGFRVLVVDRFADADTRQCAIEVFQVPSLAVPHVAPMVDAMRARYHVKQAVYGSGLEAHPETLTYLSRRFELLGNAPEVFFGQLRKAEFFAVLDRLNIPFPEISLALPHAGQDWLVKPMRGQGGVGVRRQCANPIAERGVYWQKFQPGTPGSVLFLADRQRACVLGFNSQFTINLNPGLEFAFSGLINHSTLSASQKTQVADWLDRCVRAFALQGLNSLDFIHHGERMDVLEINPRPPASMQLYGDALVQHIAACRGRLPGFLPEQKGFAGLQVVYAAADVHIAERFVWPAWVRDIPIGGTVCRKAQPICSIFAQADAPHRVLAMLATRQQQIFNQLYSVI